MNATLGAIHEVDPDQAGVPEGYIRLKSGTVVRASSQPAQAKETGGGGMLLPVIAISGAALGTYLMFKG